VKASKDRMLELNQRFYDMTSVEATQYVEIAHKPDESAVKHLLLAHEDDRGNIVAFECDYCNDKSHTMDEFERHCYLQRETHEDYNRDKIENEARKNITTIHNEFLQDVEDTIKSKKNAEYKARLAKEQAERERIKSTLPYVSKQ
jgi:hypothetical protein